MDAKILSRNNKGITVTALTITVIILLIIAGTSIKIMSDNGIIGHAKEAKENYESAEQAELQRVEELKNYRDGKYASSENGKLTVTDSASLLLKNYRIYGKSEQDGTPTPSTPVEIQSVGNRTNNIFNPKAATSKTPDNIYYGQILDASKKYTMQIELKEGKTVPSGIAFGFVYRYTEATSTSAMWFTTSAGGLTRTIGTVPDRTFQFLTVAVFPSNQETWNKILDAFEIGLYEGSYTASTIPEYEPYGYKIPITVNNSDGKNITTNIYLDEPLRAIGNDIENADYIDFASGKVVRKIGVENLADISNAFSKYHSQSSSGDYSLFFTTTFNKAKQGNVLSTHFLMGTAFQASNHITLAYSSNRIYIGINSSIVEVGDAVSFRTWLQNNKPLMQYVLKEEDTEKIELPDIPTYKGYTNISVDTTIAPSKIEIIY